MIDTIFGFILAIYFVLSLSFCLFFLTIVDICCSFIGIAFLFFMAIFSNFPWENIWFGWTCIVYKPTSRPHSFRNWFSDWTQTKPIRVKETQILGFLWNLGERDFLFYLNLKLSGDHLAATHEKLAESEKMKGKHYVRDERDKVWVSQVSTTPGLNSSVSQYLCCCLWQFELRLGHLPPKECWLTHLSFSRLSLLIFSPLNQMSFSKNWLESFPFHFYSLSD